MPGAGTISPRSGVVWATGELHRLTRRIQLPPASTSLKTTYRKMTRLGVPKRVSPRVWILSNHDADGSISRELPYPHSGTLNGSRV
jgi:hypothetical protein